MAADPTAVTPAVAADLLSDEGRCEITEEMIAADVAAGATTNSDGTINLVTYAAWILGQR